MGALFAIAGFFVWLIVVAGGALALSLGMWAPAVVCGVFVALSTSFLWNGRYRVARLLAVVAVLTLVGLQPEYLLRAAQSRIDILAARVEAKGPAGLSTVEKGGVYALGLLMGLTGFFVGYPEAAREHLLMYREGPEVRRFDGDLAMQSRRMQEAVRTALRGGRVRVTFAHDDPARVRLALDPMTLEAKHTSHGITCVGRVDLRYSLHGRATLLTIPGAPLVMPHALFYALQQEGWLHPYVAEWHWTVAASQQGFVGTGGGAGPGGGLGEVERTLRTKELLERAQEDRLRAAENALDH